MTPQEHPVPPHLAHEYGAHPAHHHHTGGHTVCWGSIFTGAVTAVAVSVILVAVGSGLGFSITSPYDQDGISAKGFTIAAAIWLIVVQWLSSGLGGYIAGRLRARQEGLHGDEVFFRDSAHGFVAWAVASVFVAGMMVSSVSAALSTGTQAASVVAAGKVSEPGSETAKSGPYDYYLDGLFRTTRATVASQDVRDETNRIVMRAINDDEVSASDRAYLGQVVAANTGLTQPEAQARVDQTITQVQDAKAKAMEAADTARKAAAKFSLLTALSLLIGAFIAGVTGVIGGRHRDLF